MNILVALGLVIATAQVGVPAGKKPIAATHAFRPGQRPNFVAMKDSAKIGVLTKTLQHDLKGCFYTSESDEPVDVIVSTGTPPGKPCDLTDAFNGLECAADSDEEAKLRIRLVHIDLEKTAHLRAYKVGGEDAVRPTYIIGGDIGDSFVGIKAKATET